MHVREADGSYGVVAKLTVVPGGMWMYNLTVAQDHTYTVGSEQWIVHNDSGCGGADPDELSQAAKEPSQAKYYSKAGRALAKHLGAGRWDLAKWLPLAPLVKSPALLNDAAQNFVDDIITSPDTIWKTHGPFLDGWEGPEDSARGARWLLQEGARLFHGLL